ISLDGTQGENGYHTSDVTVTLAATDNLSGVARTEYSLDGTNWTTYTGPFAVATEGTTTVYCRSVDNAGNEENPKQEVIKIDKVAPTIVSTDPQNAENKVLVTKTIIITFSEGVQLGPDNGGITLTLTRGKGSPVDFTARTEDNTLIIQPTADLNYNSTYSVDIPAGVVKDMAGHLLASSYSFSFTTKDR
ncbi:MAG TPA: Ig-like domain-containing protein, partial [Anaerolineae bacterium]|nr:Ig-like domain-containing protein [Anaerolineae bacterium]